VYVAEFILQLFPDQRRVGDVIRGDQDGGGAWDGAGRGVLLAYMVVSDSSCTRTSQDRIQPGRSAAGMGLAMK
jgi:hypothetical protein